ncbi:glycosyltransferase family protein [Companilactobacillus hulinensis]|uniref:hypothetical protein n=1 Tax=Companilactobacillus hulinensis TaxID=2486007 RepID=UPI000F79EE6F|nr:hypothetical protein [Companilactobacillus hulinensis]
MKKLVRNNYLILLLFLCVSVIMIGLVNWHFGYIFATGDFHYHLDRIETLADSISHLNFWPKVDGHFIGGYGYASSLFYPDIFLYPAALLRLAGATPTVSYLSTLVMINFVTLLIGYIAGKRLNFSSQKALLFTFIYSFNVYRLQTLFSRQDLGELMGMMFFPLVLSELMNFKYGKVKQWYVLSFAMIGIACSHTISLFMMIVFSALFVLLNIRVFWNKSRLISIVKAAVLTLGISAGVYLPILEQMKGQQYALTTDPLINITNEILPLKSLVYNSLTNQVFSAQTVNVGAVVIIGLIVYSICNVIQRKNLDLTIIAVLLFIACTNIFPWKVFSHTIFAMIQFPWRFFSVISLIVAYLLVNDDLHIFTNKYVVYGLVSLIALVTVGIGTQTVGQFKDKLETYKEFNHVDSFYIGAGHEYLPSEVSYPEVLQHKERVIDYNRSKVDINNSTINRQYIAFNFNTHGKTTKVTLPLIYYKGYESEVYGDSGSATTPKISNNGLTTIDLNGEGTVKVQYENTFIQKLSLMISGVSILLLALAFFNKRRRTYISLSDEVPVFVMPTEYDYVFVYQIVDDVDNVTSEK